MKKGDHYVCGENQTAKLFCQGNFDGFESPIKRFRRAPAGLDGSGSDILA